MWNCPVCDQENSSPVCPGCGFDSSCDYEAYPTLQQPDVLPDAVALLREQWNAPAAPSVTGTLAAIRSQGWDPHVLSAVEKILSAAADGNFTEQHRMEIFLDVNDGGFSLPHTESILYSPPPVKLSSFCKICGTVNGRGTFYCSGCGTRIDGSAPKTSSPIPVPPQPHTGNSLHLSKFCDHCGCSVPSGTVYCPGCGTKV